MTFSPTPPRQRFRPGIDEIPDDVLEQIAHAGDCAITGERDVWVAYLSAVRTKLRDEATARAIGGGKCPRDAVRALWPEWRRAARWAARLLGVEVK